MLRQAGADYRELMPHRPARPLEGGEHCAGEGDHGVLPAEQRGCGDRSERPAASQCVGARCARRHRIGVKNDPTSITKSDANQSDLKALVSGLLSRPELPHLTL